MPRPDQAPAASLKSLCLTNIAVHADSLWCRNFLDHYYGTAHFLYVLGPWDELPAPLLAELWAEMRRRKLLRRHHAYLLISPWARRLDLSGCGEADIGLQLTLAAQRCSRLTELELSHCRLPREQFSRALAGMTCLTRLGLAHTNTTDPQLGLLGTACPNLTSLDLSYCGQVTDRGLVSLVDAVDPDGRPDPRFGKCERLVRLVVTGCPGPSLAGVQRMLVRLPHIVTLDWPDTAGAVASLLETGQLDNSLLLGGLQCEGGSKAALSFALSACPWVSRLTVAAAGCETEPGLLAALDLRTDLEELHLYGEPGGTGHGWWEGEVGPLLRARGECLVRLELAELASVEMQLLAASCPALSHLALLWNCSYYVPAGPGPPRTFPGLKSCRLAIKGPGSDIPGPDLLSVLASPCLATLQLTQSSSLTDYVWCEARRLEGLGSLETLELLYCNKISYEVFSDILSEANRLEEVKFNRCEQIPRKDVERLRKKVKSRKWKLKIDWS